jgi:hypothetical protein
MGHDDDETIEKRTYPTLIVTVILSMLTIPMHDYDLSLLIEINRLLLLYADL